MLSKVNIPRQIKRLRAWRLGRINARKEARAQRRIRDNLEKTGFRRLNSLFRKYIGEVVTDYRESSLWEVQVQGRKLQKELRPVLVAHYRRIFQSVYKFNEERYGNTVKDISAEVFGVNRDIENIVLAYIASRESLIVNISENIARAIDRIIINGRTEGLSVRQIAIAISDKIPTIARFRANTIARTETHNAASFANHSYHSTLGDQLGLTMVKRWVATNDLRTRPAHSAANGQTVGMDEDFIVGGLPMKHAGDPRGGAKNNVNCRCVIVYVDERDSLDD